MISCIRSTVISSPFSQVKEAIQGMLSVERETQLLGLPKDDSHPNAMELLGEATDFVHDRHKNVLKDQLKKAQGSRNEVNKKEIGKAVTEILGTERQRELLGRPVDQEAMELVSRAQELFEVKGNVEIGEPTIGKQAPNSK